jgi:hypothetical protein
MKNTLTKCVKKSPDRTKVGDLSILFDNHGKVIYMGFILLFRR